MTQKECMEWASDKVTYDIVGPIFDEAGNSTRRVIYSFRQQLFEVWWMNGKPKKNKDGDYAPLAVRKETRMVEVNDYVRIQ